MLGAYRPSSYSAIEFIFDCGEFISNHFLIISEYLIIGISNIVLSVGGLHRSDICNMLESISYNPLILILSRLNNIINHIWKNVNSTFLFHVTEIDIADNFITMTSIIGPINSFIKKYFWDLSRKSV